MNLSQRIERRRRRLYPVGDASTHYIMGFPRGVTVIYTWSGDPRLLRNGYSATGTISGSIGTCVFRTIGFFQRPER
jgi:hypothetical protein